MSDPMQAVLDATKSEADLQYEKLLDQKRLGKKADQQLEDEARRERSEKLVVLSEQDFMKRPPQPFLVEDLLVEGGLYQIIGLPGTHKTTEAIHLAMSVATKLPTYRGLPINSHGEVAYIIAEGAGRFAHRLRAWRQQHQLPLSAGSLVNGQLCLLPCVVNLLDRQQVDDFIRQIGKPKLVVVDTQNRSMPGGNENGPEDMGELVYNCGRIQQATGATVVLVHHPTKSNETERGHSSVFGALDGQLWLTWADKDAGIIKMTVEKMKDAPDDFFRQLKVETVALVGDDGQPMKKASNGKPETACVLHDAEPKDVKNLDDRLDEVVFQFVLAHPGTNKTEIREALKPKRAALAIRESVDRLEKANRLKKEGSTRSSKLSVI